MVRMTTTAPMSFGMNGVWELPFGRGPEISQRRRAGFSAHSSAAGR